MARYVFITGGVVSSLGKGLASAALGALPYIDPVTTIVLPHISRHSSDKVINTIANTNI